MNMYVAFHDDTVEITLVKMFSKQDKYSYCDSAEY